MRLAELRTEIAAHPLEALALAVVVGAYLAYDRTGAARRALMTTLGGAAVGRIRDIVTRRPPRSWTDQPWPGHSS